MLTKPVIETAQDRVGMNAASGALNASGLTVTSAANTALFDRDEVQARRLRRQRRQERASRRGLGGWTVRMW